MYDRWVAGALLGSQHPDVSATFDSIDLETHWGVLPGLLGMKGWGNGHCGAVGLQRRYPAMHYAYADAVYGRDSGSSFDVT